MKPTAQTRLAFLSISILIATLTIHRTGANQDVLWRTFKRLGCVDTRLILGDFVFEEVQQSVTRCLLQCAEPSCTLVLHTEDDISGTNQCAFYHNTFSGDVEYALMRSARNCEHATFTAYVYLKLEEDDKEAGYLMTSPGYFKEIWGVHYCLIDAGIVADSRGGLEWCETLGAQLPMAETLEDIVTIGTHDPYGNDSLILGANDWEVQGTFRWPDGRPVDDSLWHGDNPDWLDERCTHAIRSNGLRMNNVYCSHVDYLVCMYECSLGYGNASSEEGLDVV